MTSKKPGRSPESVEPVDPPKKRRRGRPTKKLPTTKPSQVVAPSLSVGDEPIPKPDEPIPKPDEPTPKTVKRKGRRETAGSTKLKTASKGVYILGVYHTIFTQKRPKI